MSDLLLSRDFMTAGRRLMEDMILLRAYVEKPEGQSFLESIPVFDPDNHSFDEFEDNCYAFAIGAKGQGRLQPGFRAAVRKRPNMYDFQAFRKDIHEGLLADGAEYLGDSFADSLGKGVPMPLFLRHGQNFDFDFMALRRVFDSYTGKPDRLVFANKGNAFASSPDLRNTNIFGEARGRNYEIFGGYYALKR